MKNIFTMKTSVIIVTAVILSSCSLMSSHPKNMSNIKNELNDGNISKANIDLTKKFDIKNDELLTNLEYARILQISQDYKKSKEIFSKIIEKQKKLEMSAKYKVSSLFANTAAIMTNDKNLQFYLPDYALSFLYMYQSLNYLADKNLSDALVSIRRLSEAQAWTVRQKKIETEGRKVMSDDYHASASDFSIDDIPKISQMNKYSSKITNSYENPAAYILASILYMADNNYNDAFISIKNAKRIVSDNKYINELYKQIENGHNSLQVLPKSRGRLVVFSENDFVIQKEDVSFRMPFFIDSNNNKNVRTMIANVTFPVYKATNTYLNHPKIIIKDANGRQSVKGNTQIATNVNLLAMKSLSEEYPAIIVRNILRNILQNVTSAQKGDVGGSYASLATSIFFMLVSDSDLRSWLLLPRSIDIYTKTFPVGQYNISIAGKTVSDSSIDIKSGKTTLIWNIKSDKLNENFVFYI